MMTLIREGGFPIWFVLLFGMVTLAGAVAYAVKAQDRLLGLVRGIVELCVTEPVEGAISQVTRELIDVALRGVLR